MAKRVVVEFAGDTSKLDSAFAKVKKGSTGVESAIKGIAGAAVFGMVTAQIGDAIQASSALSESMSKSANVFGANAAAIDAWAQQGAEDFGLSKQAALEAASTFGNMFSQLGVGSGQAAQLSQNMVELAADFASFHNADISQVIDAQSAAFRGEYDSLQRFLPLINAATVEQEAMAMTGKKNKDALTAQEKALAVNNLMMKGAGAAAGDFDRTSDSLANQQRKLSANIENTQAIIGQKLQPVMQKVLSWLNSDGIPGFLKLTEVVGEGMADAAGFFIGALADMASATAQLLEKIDQFVPGLEGVPERLQRGVREMRLMEAGLHDVNIEMGFATGALADHKAAQEVAAKAIGQTTAETKEQAKATTDLRDAQLSARSTELALDQSTRNLAKAQEEYNKFLETGGIDTEKVKRAQEDLVRAQNDLEKATKGVAEAQELVNKALKPATLRDQEKAQRDISDANDDVTLAQLDLADAQREHIHLINSKGIVSEAELTRSRIRVSEATRNLKDAEDRATEATEAHATLMKQGTTDSDAYKSAVEILKARQDDLKTATDAQKLAQDAMNTSQALGKDHAEKLWQVTQDLAAAELDLDTKTWSAEKAQRALKEAVSGTNTQVRDLWGNVVGLKEDLAAPWTLNGGHQLPGEEVSHQIIGRFGVNPAVNPNVQGPVMPGYIRARAGGGRVAAGHPYVVGEMGPEMFVPNRSGTIIPNGGGGSVNIVVNGWVGNDVELTRKIIGAIAREQRLSGLVGIR